MGLTYPQTFLLVVSCTFFYSLHGILFNLSREKGGEIPFQVSTIVFLSEVLKLAVAVFMMIYEMGTHPVKVQFSVKETILLGIPGFIYAVNNTLAFRLLNYVDPATFQLLSNMKVITTTVLAWWILTKIFSSIQWGSLAILFIGSSLSTISTEKTSSSFITLGATSTGFIGMIVYCTLSAIAGIVTEYAMKINENTSIHYQNVQMYIFGVIFNLFSCYSEGGGDPVVIFTGLTSSWWVLMVILNQGLTGLLISAIMKFADNIVKLFCISGAAIVSYILSNLLFGVGFTITWFASAILITLSVYLYNYQMIVDYFKPEVELGKDEQV
jgi:UDP-galactose transporter